LDEDARTSIKVFAAANVKRAAVPMLVSLALASQAFALLRPLFPVKPAPPFSGDMIVIGDDLIRRSAKKASDTGAR
jgi:hypothetical protein